jgi:fibronectin-binding autotransporter adhesin
LPTDKVQGGLGDDIITLAGAETMGAIEGNEGNDTISLLSGTAGTVAGGKNDDVVALEGAQVDSVRGGDGNDAIALLSGTATSGVDAGAGDDTVTLANASIGDLEGGDGDDLIVLSGTGMAGSVDGGADDDTIILNGATVAGDIDGGAGKDLIELRDGAGLSGTIQGGDDDDELVLFSGAFDTDLTAATGGDGSDTVTFHNFSGTISEAGEWETVGVRNGSDATLNGLTDVEAVRVEDSRIVLVDTAVLGDVGATDGGADNQETIVLGAGTTVGGGVFGGLGDDSLEILDGFDLSGVPGGYDGGAGGSDSALFTGVTGTLAGEALVGWETVDLAVQTDLTLAGAALVTGSDAGQGLIVRDGAVLRFANDFLVDGDLTNFGTVDLGVDGAAGTDLTITGDYTAGSDLFMDVFVGLDGSVAADTLTIEGAATGDTLVTLNLLEEGEAGDSNRVLLISVGEASDGTFALSDPVISGLFELELVSEDGQNWFLESSEIFIGQSFAYESLPSALQAVGSAAIGTLAERVGVGGAVAGIDGPALALPMSSGVWGRLVGVSAESEGDLGSATGGSFEQTVGLLQAGAEFVASDSASGRLLIGGMAHIGQSSLDAFDRFGAQRGDIDIDAYGGGLNVTWYGSGGFYADGVVQYTAYDMDVNTTGSGRVGQTDGWGVAISGEAGYRLPIGDNLALVPQGQLIWQTVDFDDFTDRDGIAVRLDDGDSLVGRLGVAIEGTQLFGSALITGYAEANLLHEFLGDNQVTAADTSLTQDLGGTSAELGLGGTLAISDSVSIYGEVDYRLPFDDGVEAVQASGGLRVNW